MAIIIEEPTKKSGTPFLLGMVIFVAIIGGGAYYVFFAPAPAAIVTPPPNYASIAPIASISFDPTSLLNSPGFQALKLYVAEPTSTGPGAVGRPNPFVAP